MSLIALIAAFLALGCSRDGVPMRSDSATVAPPPLVQTEPAHPDSSQSAPRDCGIGGGREIDKGIGDLKPGRSVADVVASCEVMSDSRQLGTEGMTERVLVVRIEGASVRAIVNDDRVWRIEVTSPQFKTSDSLGVDTPLRRIARTGGARFFPGEGGVYAFLPEHCALSFRFSVPLRPPRGGDWTAAAIEKAHGDAAVDRVLITNCRN